MVVVACEVRVVQVVPLRRCSKTPCLVSGTPLAVRVPEMVKEYLARADEGAEMVRALGGLASIKGVALQNNNAQITNTTATTITALFSRNIPPHLER